MGALETNHSSTSMFICGGYLLADVVETSVFSVTLVRFSQDGVEGFVAVPPGCPGVTGDGERRDVNLAQMYLFILNYEAILNRNLF